MDAKARTGNQKREKEDNTAVNEVLGAYSRDTLYDNTESESDCCHSLTINVTTLAIGSRACSFAPRRKANRIPTSAMFRNVSITFSRNSETANSCGI